MRRQSHRHTSAALQEMSIGCFKNNVQRLAGGHYSKITLQELVVYLAGKDFVPEDQPQIGLFQMKAVVYSQVWQQSAHNRKYVLPPMAERGLPADKVAEWRQSDSDKSAGISMRNSRAMWQTCFSGPPATFKEVWDEECYNLTPALTFFLDNAFDSLVGRQLRSGTTKQRWTTLACLQGMPTDPEHLRRGKDEKRLSLETGRSLPGLYRSQVWFTQLLSSQTLVTRLCPATLLLTR